MRYANRVIIKKEVLADWDKIQQHFGKKSKLRIRWLKQADVEYLIPSFFPSGHGMYPENVDGWVTVSLMDNLVWFFHQGGRDAVRYMMTHEAFHRFVGLRHGLEARRMGYFSRPWKKDIYTWRTYRKIFDGGSQPTSELDG